MTRPRPYIPLEIRCRAILRQQGWKPDAIEKRIFSEDHLAGGIGYKAMLANLLAGLALTLNCDVDDFQLDHNPALILRPYNPRIKNVAARYTPNANDPDHLEYRPQAADAPRSHHIKTNVRGDGALRSDTSERVYRRKVERNKLKRAGKIKVAKIPQAKKPWPSRPFPKRGKS